MRLWYLGFTALASRLLMFLQVAAIGLYVQSYLCWRLWVISKKWWVAAFIQLVCIFGFLSMAVAVSSRRSTPANAYLLHEHQLHFIYVLDIPLISAWRKTLISSAR
jgi:hypothetical protein